MQFKSSVTTFKRLDCKENNRSHRNTVDLRYNRYCKIKFNETRTVMKSAAVVVM